jgi:hypothetical protein
VSGAEQTHSRNWTLGLRWVEGQIDRAAFRSTLTYKPMPRLSLGVEYNPLAGDINPLANWLAVKETEQRPAIMFGTSSDRIGTDEGQSFFGTMSKSLKSWTGLPIAPYVGAAYGTYDYTLRAIGGVNVRLSERASSLLIFDGVNLHPTLSWAAGDQHQHMFSFLLVEGVHPGIAYSLTFSGPSKDSEKR